MKKKSHKFDRIYLINLINKTINYLKWYLQTRRKVSYTTWMKNTQERTKQQDLSTNFKCFQRGLKMRASY